MQGLQSPYREISVSLVRRAQGSELQINVTMCA